MTPATLTLSKFVWPSTSISPFKSRVDRVDIPITFKVFALTSAVDPPPADPVIVTIPAEIADTDRLSPKFIVPAVPTVVLLSFTTTPEPEATTPVNAEPSPLNCVAVTTPVILMPPVPVIDLLNKSKLPPSWGDKSSTRLPIP